ncbi:MAG: bifunctional folylpolyglutamate synthase/dihydrofolate synthase [Lachnospiraceae bacterium]|nr:bifunctional folylpolyglutamate synthase/dihydrofolate synthase [Lachnospiraceae bacterium]
MRDKAEENSTTKPIQNTSAYAIQRKHISTYEKAVEYLLSIPRFTTKHTPEATKRQLYALGAPDRKLRIIHVAGTNGKGSVCAYMRHILEAAGYTTCVFTSPHLVDIRERFLIKGELVSEEAFLQAFLRVYESLDWEALERGEGYHPTFFEYLFFMAMLLFAEANADYCILETGLGGRLDATNAVEQKELTIITRLGLDHTEYLGNTIGEIAAEKAGIMRPNVPVVCVESDEESSGVLREKATKLGAPIYSLSKKDYSFLNFKNKNIDFSVHTEYYGNVRLELHTQARYQMENASLAILAIGVLDGGSSVLPTHLQEGVRKCVWQGRMEEILPNVYVDGAHNEDGIRAFMETVGADGCKGRRSLLFSVVQDKDYRNMIKDILQGSVFSRIAIAPMRTARATDVGTLEKIFAEHEKNINDCEHTIYDSVETALRELLHTQEAKEYIYIAGSLYLVGEIKELMSVGGLHSMKETNYEKSTLN